MADSRISKEQLQKQVNDNQNDQHALNQFNDSLQEDSKITAGSLNQQNISHTAHKTRQTPNDNSGLHDVSIIGPSAGGPNEQRGSPFAEQDSKFLIDRSLMEGSIDATQPSKLESQHMQSTSLQEENTLNSVMESQQHNNNQRNSGYQDLNEESIENNTKSKLSALAIKNYAPGTDKKSIKDHMLMSANPSSAIDSVLPSLRGDGYGSSIKQTPLAPAGKQQSQNSVEGLTENNNDKSYEFIHGTANVTKSNDENSFSIQGKPKMLRRGDGRLKKAARQALPFSQKHINDVIYPLQTKKGIKYGPTPSNQYNNEGKNINNSFLPSYLVQKDSNFRKNISFEAGGPTNLGSTNIYEFNQGPQPVVVGQRTGRILDGFLILHSCRVKLPHEAIVSKLQSKKIFDVIEEDLCYFQNLTELDLSDNRMRLEQLKNLKNLANLNLQFNNIQVIPFLMPHKQFNCLETLNLAYNCLTVDSISSLYAIGSLKKLDLSSNGLDSVPNDLKNLNNLEQLNLSGNKFDSMSGLVNPSLFFKTLGQMPRLKSLNLSRNKFIKLHADMLVGGNDFQQLQELDISQNKIEVDNSLWYLLQCPNLNVIVITGNPFATRKSNYENLELSLQKNLAAVLINDSHLVDDQGFYIKTKVKEEANLTKTLTSLSYPDPIKFERKGAQTTVLGSEATDKFIPGDYLSAEMMKAGIAIQMTDIRPNTNDACEIFPRSSSKQQNTKNNNNQDQRTEQAVFTPPDHKQLKFATAYGGQSSKINSIDEDRQPLPTTTAGTAGFGGKTTAADDGFFITEDLNQNDALIGRSADRDSQEENMDPMSRQQRNNKNHLGEVITEEASDFTNEYQNNQKQTNNQPDYEDITDDDQDQEFDYGVSKMDFFKRRCREILVDRIIAEDYNNYSSAEGEVGLAYEGDPLPIKQCFNQLKNLMRRPCQSMGSHTVTGQVPSFMKPTFISQRNAAANSSVLQFSTIFDKMNKKADLQKISHMHNADSIRIMPNTAPVPFRVLTYQQAGQTFDQMLLKTMQGNFRGKNQNEYKVLSKREQLMDEKIERLLLGYKRNDEKIANKKTTTAQDKEIQKQQLLEKFGFEDEREYDLDQEDARRAKSKNSFKKQQQSSGNRNKSCVRPMAPSALA